MTQTTAETSSDTSQAPAPPREITSRAARRAWAEISVQGWWKSAIVIAVVTIFVAVFQIQSEMHDRSVILNGKPATAKIVEVNGTSRYGYAVQRDDSVAVKLSWPDDDGAMTTVSAILPRGAGYAKVGQTIQIRYDPNNPSDLTDQTQVLPWWRVLAVSLFMLVPIMLILLVIAAWQRQRILRTWRDGELHTGIVIGCKHSATAPQSQLCRFSYADADDRRIFKLLYPRRGRSLQPGEHLSLIALAKSPARAIVAELYLPVDKH